MIERTRGPIQIQNHTSRFKTAEFDLLLAAHNQLYCLQRYNSISQHLFLLFQYYSHLGRAAPFTQVLIVLHQKPNAEDPFN